MMDQRIAADNRYNERMPLLQNIVLRRAAAASLAIALVAASIAGFGRESLGTVSVATLPPEARTTLELIRSGGPFPYSRDGVVFNNREHILPAKARGYYHEYTVPTPRARSRGARRIVCGGALATLGECYYSDDHYQTFRKIQP
jgi:ribonuclease T1